MDENRSKALAAVSPRSRNSLAKARSCAWAQVTWPKMLRLFPPVPLGSILHWEWADSPAGG